MSLRVRIWVDRVLTDFIIFTRSDGELQKVLLRPHQMRAVDKVVERAVDVGQSPDLEMR